ncbi:Kinesin-like protein, partial [Drosera capensis]
MYAALALMENVSRSGFHDFNWASRKAEEAALRRYQAVHWLDCLVGPLGVADQPSEKEFIACLRNGLILCNAINKIQPGSVPKVVENHLPMPSLTWDSQPLPAYQYFENVRNFLFAVEELKLPAFEASDLEREAYEAGSAGRVVDCILALKAYHDLKQVNGGSGVSKRVKSPLLTTSGSKNLSRPQNAAATKSHRQLDMSAAGDALSLEESICKALADCMFNAKENLDDNFLASFHTKNKDVVKGLRKILAICMDDKLENKVELTSCLQDILKEQSVDKSPSKSRKKLPQNTKDLKALLSQTKEEFEHLQSLLLNDLKQLDTQVKDMSTASLGYHKVVQENRNLYNLVQDLKGNVRVYCRIRPIFDAKANNVIDFIGEDGSVVVVDPSKPQKDRRHFQFNRVYGPTATQDEVFKDTQPLIRCVMDGYNVCILAYGQTGSGKTYTMCGPSGGSTKDMGINYLALNDLFEMSNQRKDIINYEIRAQMVEIYNEQGGMSLPDAVLLPVKSTADVLNLMKLGEINRAVCSTAMNNQSSRSHSVLTVHVNGKYTSGSALHSRLHLVDLAGSERVDKSEVSGDRLKEAQHINKSLSCLGDVFLALSQKCSHVPYRNSKLTLLLQDALGGNAKTLMFAHVSPEGDDFSETVSTLKFAQRVSTVELGAASLNKQSSEVMELRQQVENLRKALMNKESMNLSVNRHPTTPCEKPKIASDKCPQRSRRLSIENKEPAKAMINRAPLRSRRMSLEHPSLAKSETSSSSMPKSRRLSIETLVTVKHDEVRNSCCMNPEKVPLEFSVPGTRRMSSEHSRMMQVEKMQSIKPGRLKEQKSSSSSGQVKTGTTEQTPPRPRRLSIENQCAMRSDKTTSTDSRRDNKTTSSTSTKHTGESGSAPARRLSLEGPKSTKMKCFEIDMSEDMCKLSDSNSDLCSPGHSFTCLGQPTLADYESEAPFFQPEFTTEPIILSGPGFEFAMDGEFNITNDFQTSEAVRSGHGKRSQIKKSIRTLGKFINGLDKKSQQKTEAHIRSRNTAADAKWSVKTSSTGSRRESLIGIQSTGPEKVRRSSLGGKSTDACVSESRMAKSPPPSFRSSAKKTGNPTAGHRWMVPQAQRIGAWWIMRSGQQDYGAAAAARLIVVMTK